MAKSNVRKLFYPDDVPHDDPELIEFENHSINARTVPCRYCGAAENQPCKNYMTGKELGRTLSHPGRVREWQHHQSEKGEPMK